jgi:predicted transcriptional regulator
MADETSDTNVIELATELTIAWLGNPNVRAAAAEVPAFLKEMHAALTELSVRSSAGADDAGPTYTPAVPVRTSIKPDYLLSLIDGKRYKLLKRHLSGHGLTPAEYRQRYGLKADYPMVAPKYAEARRELAKKIGLGRKPGAKVVKRGGRGKASAAG